MNLTANRCCTGHTLTTPEPTLPQYVPRPTALSPAPTYVSRAVRHSPEPVPEADEEGRRASGVSYASDAESAHDPRAV